MAVLNGENFLYRPFFAFFQTFHYSIIHAIIDTLIPFCTIFPFLGPYARILFPIEPFSTLSNTSSVTQLLFAICTVYTTRLEEKHFKKMKQITWHMGE